MARWNLTNFTEFCGDGSPSEQYSETFSRAVRQLDVIPGTTAARQQAVQDFLGWNELKTTVNSSGQTLRYISRGTPMPYAFSQAKPSLLPISQYLYAANIARGQSIGPTGTTSQAADVGTGNLVSGDFNHYRFTVEFTTRTYDIKADNSVDAVASAALAMGQTGRPSGTYSYSPLYDTVSGVGYPDEGQMLAGISFFGVFAGGINYGWPGLGTPWPNGKPAWSTASRYITRIFRPSARMRVLPFGMLTWFSDSPPMPIREGFPFNETTGSVRYEWACVPEAGVPWFAIQQQLNTINADWFDGFPPSVLMFKSMDHRRYIDKLGAALYTMEYIFSFLPNVSPDPTQNGYPSGWNSQLRVKGTPPVLQYDYVVDSNLNGINRRSPYRTSDFSNLFRPDQSS
jgi:hypothetical protein